MTQALDDPSLMIHLGFSEPIQSSEVHLLAHHLPNPDDWDGGQIGGRPSWLVPSGFPSRISCTLCQHNMTFVCQLYAPLDDIPAAFHRTLYVFCCRSCCSSKSRTTTGCIRVLRAQLPEYNPYYPMNDYVEGPTRKPAKDNLCAVCGVRATKKCPLQQLYFCSPEHQREYKRHVFGKDDLTGDDVQQSRVLPSLFPLSELVVEGEPPPAHDSTENERTTMFTSGDSDDSDADLEQDDLNDIVAGRTSNASASRRQDDPVHAAFVDRIQSRPDVQSQCVRYCRWNGDSVLWAHSQDQPEFIPPCQYCHAPRQFEFQLMPQLLHYLLASDKKGSTNHLETIKQSLQQADHWLEQAPPEHIPPALHEAKQTAIANIHQQLLHDSSLDWGTAAVFTCTESCGNLVVEDAMIDDADLGLYREEFAWRQPSMDE